MNNTDINIQSSKKSNESNPLVSIIVITYNSSKYVLETLESAKSQTYQNIELIISDDCSTDNTVEICQKWVSENKDRFVRVELITSEKNTGIPTNCNRGLKFAKGEWVKSIAGDDILLNDCIEQNIFFAQYNKFKFVASNVFEFTGLSHSPDYKWKWEVSKRFRQLNTAKQQFKYFLTGNTYLSAPTFFIQKKELLNIGGFIEKYSLVEDIPLLLNWTFNGNMIGVLNEVTVYHRRHDKGLTNKNIFPYYLIDVYRAIIDFSIKSKRLLYLANGVWNLFLLLIERRFYGNSVFQIVQYIRITFQPIRLLWFKRKLSGKNV